MGLYGIIGRPLKHSLSPLMHNAAFQAAGLPDSTYKLFETLEADLEGILKNLRANGVEGVNVTVPYKEKARAFLDSESEAVRAISAVNTIVVRGGTLAGHNTDATGFARSLAHSGFRTDGASVLILGAGGAARAVVHALAVGGAGKITICNRSRDRADRLAEDFSQSGVSLQTADPADGFQESWLGAFDLAVNCTSLGLRDLDPLPIQLPDSGGPGAVMDLVYNPIDTRFLKGARKAGARTVNGLGMLVFQAAEAFRLWTGIDLPPETFERPLTEANPLWRMTGPAGRG